MAVVLFMSSTVNVNANTQKDFLDNTDCWALADAVEAAYNAGMGLLKKVPTYEESFLVWEAAYLGCI